MVREPVASAWGEILVSYVKCQLGHQRRDRHTATDEQSATPISVETSITNADTASRVARW